MPYQVGGVSCAYPHDSLPLADELAAVRAAKPLDPMPGRDGGDHGRPILEMCARWGMKSSGVADVACFAKGGHTSGSIADEFARGRVYFRPAKKADRITGWNLMRRLLADAGSMAKPGLYVSRACEYFWATVPYLARDQKRVEDVDSSGPDHAADACRYGLLRKEYKAVIMPFRF